MSCASPQSVTNDAYLVSLLYVFLCRAKLDPPMDIVCGLLCQPESAQVPSLECPAATVIIIFLGAFGTVGPQGISP